MKAQPKTLDQVYRDNLARYIKNETRKNEKKYTDSLRSAKFPMDRKIALRSALEATGTSEVNGWMKVFAELIGDKTIGEFPKIPVTTGTAIVPLTKKSGVFTANVTHIVTDPVKADLYCYIARPGVDSEDGQYFYAVDIVRYATDEEIDAFVASVTPTFRRLLSSGNCLSAINAHCESQLVYSQADDGTDADVEEFDPSKVELNQQPVTN